MSDETYKLLKYLIKTYSAELNSKNFKSLFNKLYKHGVETSDIALFIKFLLNHGVNPFQGLLSKEYDQELILNTIDKLLNRNYVFSKRDFKDFYPIIEQDLPWIAQFLGYDVFSLEDGYFIVDSGIDVKNIIERLTHLRLIGTIDIDPPEYEKLEYWGRSD